MNLFDKIVDFFIEKPLALQIFGTIVLVLFASILVLALHNASSELE